MAVSKPQTRFAHIDGHTDVCYDDSGKYLLTGGADGDVRVWNGFDDDNAVSHRAGDCVYGILLKGKRLFTAADSNVVQIYTFPELSADGIVTRCTSRITHLSLNSSGSHMAVCSSDFDIKYVEIESNAQKMFEGHTAPVLSVAVDPRSEFLASSACDGLVKVWHIPTQKPVSNMKLLSSCNDVSLADSLCRMSWSPPNGATLAVPAKGKVELYQRGSWKKIEDLIVDGIEKHFNVAAFSPDGRFLCGATTDGWIVLWSTATGSSWTLAKKWKLPKAAAVTSLAWNPAADTVELCFADSQGQFGIIQKVTEGLTAKPPAAAAAAAATTPQASKEARPAGGKAGEQRGLADGIHDSGTVQDGGDSSDDDDLADIRRLRELVGISHSVETSGVLGDEDEDDVESLGSVGTANVAAQQPSAAKAEVRPSQTPVVTSAAAVSVAQQAPFKPGCTPVGLQSRFMVWNSVGVVRQYVGDADEDSTIDVEFHDTSVHHSLHLSNSVGYSMADLSKEALVLASEGEADPDANSGSTDGSSQLFCMHFGSWDAAKEWAVTMPDGERVEVLALSDRWLAAATSRRTVRLFTTCGSQLGTFSIGGRVVALAAQGQALVVAYHRGAVASGDQYLAVELLEVKGRVLRSLCNRDLPLSPRATLSWLGFSDEGTPVAYDSAGVLRLLSAPMGMLWVEIANLKAQAKGRSDNYWLVGVSEQSRQSRCVYCRGSTFPPTLPRPVMSLLSFQMPFCEMLNEKGQLEEKVWQSRVLGGCAQGPATSAPQDSDEACQQQERQESCLRDEQAALIKLFAMACKSEREYRALQLCDLMPTVRALESAAKYATHLRRADLVRRINELITAREAAAAAEALEEDAGRGRGSGSSYGTAAASSLGHFDSSKSRHNGSGSADHDDQGLSQSAVTMDGLNDSQRSFSCSAEAEAGEPRKRLLVTKRSVASTPKPALLPLSQGSYKNPFKLGPVDTPTTGSRGSSVFDSIEKAQPTKETSVKSSDAKSKPSSGVQCRLFEKAKVEAEGAKAQNASAKPVTAFDLWLAENEESIRAGAGEGDEILTLATEAFQQLPREEKKKWMARTKSLPPGDEPKKRKTEDIENGRDGFGDGCDAIAHHSKRQSPDGEDASASVTRKQPLTSGGNAQTKLAAFAFAKQGSS